jgi:hypothetical protein
MDDILKKYGVLMYLHNLLAISGAHIKHGWMIDEQVIIFGDDDEIQIEVIGTEPWYEKIMNGNCYLEGNDPAQKNIIYQVYMIG